MQDRLTRAATVIIAVLLAVLVAQPYVNNYLFSAREPRPPAPRGDLTEFERSTIRLADGDHRILEVDQVLALEPGQLGEHAVRLLRIVEANCDQFRHCRPPLPSVWERSVTIPDAL
jgi:hypothetical protein